MPTENLNVGIEARKAYSSLKHKQIDFILQNLSGNNVYFGNVSGVSVTSGIEIAADGVLELKEWKTDIYLIADGADSDVRFVYQEYDD